MFIFPTFWIKDFPLVLGLYPMSYREPDRECPIINTIWSGLEWPHTKKDNTRVKDPAVHVRVKRIMKTSYLPSMDSNCQSSNCWTKKNVSYVACACSDILDKARRYKGSRPYARSERVRSAFVVVARWAEATVVTMQYHNEHSLWLPDTDQLQPFWYYTWCLRPAAISISV